MDSNNIDLLAENAVKSIKHAEHYCHPDAFRELSERLISAGKSKNTKVMNRYLSDDASSPKQCTAVFSFTLLPIILFLSFDQNKPYSRCSIKIGIT